MSRWLDFALCAFLTMSREAWKIIEDPELEDLDFPPSLTQSLVKWQKLNQRNRENSPSYLFLQRFNKFWVWRASNDRKCRLTIFLLKALLKMREFFWRILVIWSHCATAATAQKPTPISYLLKVNKSQNTNVEQKLLPIMKKGDCFSILTIRIYLKLEIETSSFKYFQTTRIEKQIRSFVFWEKVWLDNFVLKFIDL